jgi:hypothetical protein
MGFRDIPRSDYLSRLDEAVKRPGKSGRWSVEADLATVAEWQPGKSEQPNPERTKPAAVNTSVSVNHAA